MDCREISCKVEQNLCASTNELNCDVCKKHFSDTAALDNHVCICIPLKEKKFSCDVCQKRFTTKQTMQLHTQQHTGKNKYVCEICKKGLYNKTHLTNHYRHKHTGERPFVCDVCGKSFVRESDLNIHNRFHTGEKLFKCDRCPKVYVNKGHFKNHYLIHTGEKNFKCEICGKCFNNNNLLKYHQIIHTAEKKFSCKFCNKTFKRASSITDHYVTHTKDLLPFKLNKNIKQNDFVESDKQNLFDLLPKKIFRCLFCKRCFSKKFTLEKHILTHTSTKSFTSPVSKKACKTKGSLSIHSHFRTQEKPYECKFCKERFVGTFDLQVHLIVKHEVEI